MSLQSDLQKLFGSNGTLGPLAFGAPDSTGLPHNGVDFILPAGTAVKAPIAGTVVVNQGPTIAVQTAGGQILSFWHVIPNAALAVGSKITAGTQLGTIDWMTGTKASGWRYVRDGYAAYSDTPHLHIAVDSTVLGAQQDTGGVNPAAFISQLAAGATPTTSATPTANAAPTPTAKATGTPTATHTTTKGGSGDILQNAWNAVVTAATGSSLKPPASAGTDTSPGGVVNTVTSDVSAWSQGLDNQATSWLLTQLGLPTSIKSFADLGKVVGKYAVIAVLAIVGLLIFLELFKGEAEGVVHA